MIIKDCWHFHEIQTQIDFGYIIQNICENDDLVGTVKYNSLVR